MGKTTSNQSITAAVRPAIEELDRFVASAEVFAALRKAWTQAVQSLHSDQALRASAVSVDLSAFGVPIPAQVASIRVVATRDAGGDGIERHANCTQYLYVLDGPLETHVQTAAGWRVDRYGQGQAEVLEDRWHVVPPGTWHRSVAPGLSNWGVVALHTARDVEDEYQ